MDFTTKDSGARQDFNTGSRRDTRDGKGRYDLLPHFGMQRLAQLYERGAAKYGDRNWEKGQPLTRYADSMLRHAFQAAAGLLDEDHWAAVAWNALAVIDHQERIDAGLLDDSLDDLPTPGEIRGQQPLFPVSINGETHDLGFLVTEDPDDGDNCCECDDCFEVDDDEYGDDDPRKGLPFTYFRYLGHGATTIEELIGNVDELRLSLIRQMMLGRDLSQPVQDGFVFIEGFTPDVVEL